MDEAMTVAAKLSSQSDRALFLFCLVILGAFGVAVVRYLVKRDEKKSDQLVGLFEKSNTGQIEVAKVLQGTTDILCETKDQLRENTEFLRRLSEKI